MNNQERTLEEKWATWVIGLSIATFLVCGVTIGLLNCNREIPIVQHKVVFATDSLGNDVYSKSQVDSLILIVQNQERTLSQKYQYILEERKKEESSRTMITFIVGAIISVCGFFGYKSFRDIKKHGEKIADKKAVETAQNTIKAQLPELLNTEMTKIYKGQSIDVIKQSLSQELTATLELYLDAIVAEKVEDMKKEIIADINNPAEAENKDQEQQGEANTKIEDSILFE